MTNFAPGSDVAVVITCHNQGHFLRESVESVRAQTHTAADIVVVDDGSTDQTADIARSSSGVRLISQERGGLSSARNTGLRATCAEFIVFLDADDRLLPDALESGRRLLASRADLAFVHGGFRMISADGQPLSEHLPLQVDDPFTGLLRGNYVAMHGTVMYRRKLLLETGGFNVACAACEDYDLYLRIARKAPIASHTSLVAEYRSHGENMSSNPALMLATSVSVLKAQSQYISGDAAKRQAFRSGLRHWRLQYGSHLATQSLQQIGQGKFREGLAGLAVFVRYGGTAIPRASAKAAYRILKRNSHRVPRPIRQIAGHLTGRSPMVGHVRMGHLRRLSPIDAEFGYGRGRPIDRYYIESFLSRHSGDIRGHVLEIGDRDYTGRFGKGVQQSDVLHVHEGNPIATWVADLTSAEHIPSDLFDCIVLTQTLHLIYDVGAAARTLHRILKPGGVVLATVPGITQIDSGEWGKTWFWSFTPASATRLFEDVFGRENVSVGAHGNVLASIGFLHGMADSELERSELDHVDACYPVTITVRAIKAMQAS